MKDTVEITSADYWFKVVGMLQQNWALIERGDTCPFVVYFIHDASGVIDQIEFDSEFEAESALLKKGFIRYSDDTESQKFISPPDKPFVVATHPNGPIYSSGKYWV